MMIRKSNTQVEICVVVISRNKSKQNNAFLLLFSFSFYFSFPLLLLFNGPDSYIIALEVRQTETKPNETRFMIEEYFYNIWLSNFFYVLSLLVLFSCFITWQ